MLTELKAATGAGENRHAAADALETALLVDHVGDDNAEPVAAWIEDNREWVDSLTS